jgi:amino acid adenylation domain-containing protein
MNVARYFQSSALGSPDLTTLHFEDGSVSYGALLAQAQRIRSALPNVGRVGLLAHRSPVAYAGLHAILARGSTYVPMKPHSPAEYLATILELSDLDCLVVGEECAKALEGVLRITNRSLIVVTYGRVEAILDAVGSRPDVSVLQVDPQAEVSIQDVAESDSGLASILFTSGSTGVPKGVKITHRAIESYVEWFTSIFETNPDDRLSQVFDLPFDCSLHDLFVSWKSKASMVVIPDRLILSPLEFARKMGITCWYGAGSFPVNLESFGLARTGALPNVRLSLFAGEKLTWNALRIWKNIAPHSTRCMNLYGPTETNVVTWFDIPQDYPESDCFQGGIPIGRILPGHKAEIRRPDGQLCGPGEQGLLFVAGTQVSPGYLDPSKTAESFLEKDGETWYGTGDLVFTDSSGELQFVGRNDFQVKVMGCRIELGEIEAILLRETGAAFAVVDVLRGQVDEIICVLPAKFADRKNEIRKMLKDKVEPYMVPRLWKFLEQLPRNANGKIDRAALKATWKTTSDREE